MRRSDELEKILSKYWDQMSEGTRALAVRTIHAAREEEDSSEASPRLFSFLDEGKPAKEAGSSRKVKFQELK